MTKDDLRREYAECISPKERREVWKKALRSGLYKQTQGRLELEGAHCCLGVLCDLSDPKRETWEGDAAAVPDSVRTEVNMCECYGGVDHNDDDDVASSLDMMNDEDELSFPEIAEYIDRLRLDEEEE